MIATETATIKNVFKNVLGLGMIKNPLLNVNQLLKALLL